MTCAYKELNLRCSGYRCNGYVKTTLNTVVKQKIQRLDVESNRRCELVEIPPTIYTSCESLVSLKINRAWLPKPPESVSLPCLKTMDLRQIEFVDNLGLEMLISACPVLETLTMDNMYGVKVSSLSLLSFFLTTNEDNEYPITQVVMQTPKLKYLKLKRHRIETYIRNRKSKLLIVLGPICFNVNK